MKTYVTEFFVHLKDLVCNLSAGDHGPLTDLLEHRARQKDQLLVLLLFVVAFVVVLNGRRLHDLTALLLEASKIKVASEGG